MLAFCRPFTFSNALEVPGGLPSSRLPMTSYPCSMALSKTFWGHGMGTRHCSRPRRSQRPAVGITFSLPVEEAKSPLKAHMQHPPGLLWMPCPYSVIPCKTIQEHRMRTGERVDVTGGWNHLPLLSPPPPKSSGITQLLPALILLLRIFSTKS